MCIAVVLAIDLGGSSMKGAVVAEDGVTVASETRSTPDRDIVEALVDLLRSLERVATNLGCSVIGAGVVTPGIVDEETGVVLFAANLNWRDIPLLRMLRDQFGFPIALGHDVRAAGLAERQLGAARGAGDFVIVTIGTGVAAALVSTGRTIVGASGSAGEFGHIPAVPGGEPCRCGQRGCLEVYVSGAGLAHRYAVRAGGRLSSQEIVSRLGPDQVANEVWSDAVHVLAQGLVIMTLLLDPAVIVLGGGFSLAGNVLLAPVKAALAQGLAWRNPPDVRLSGLGSHAGQIGAAMLAYRAAGKGSVPERWPARSGLAS